jgi:hypothetical protein
MLAVFPSLARMSFSLIPARESLVSDILAGDGKTATLFCVSLEEKYVLLLPFISNESNTI